MLERRPLSEREIESESSRISKTIVGLVNLGPTDNGSEHILTEFTDLDQTLYNIHYKTGVFHKNGVHYLGYLLTVRRRTGFDDLTDLMVVASGNSASDGHSLTEIGFNLEVNSKYALEMSAGLTLELLSILPHTQISS